MRLRTTANRTFTLQYVKLARTDQANSLLTT